MNFDSFLGEKRWEILEIVAKNPSSPIEIAEKLGTTVSYISQQLKLLEAARIIYKTKTGSAEKGKPRSLYAISEEFVYVISLTKGFSNKKLIYLSPYHKIILAVWTLEDASLHNSMQNLIFKLIESNLDFDSLFLDRENSKLIIVSNSKEIKSKVDSFVKILERKVDYSIIGSCVASENTLFLTGRELKRGEK